MGADCRPEPEAVLAGPTPLADYDLEFIAGACDASRAGVVHCFAATEARVVRFDATRGLRYPDLPAAEQTTALLVDPQNADLYLGDRRGRVERIDALTGRRSLVAGVGRVGGLFDLGAHLVVADDYGQRIVIVDKSSGERIDTVRLPFAQLESLAVDRHHSRLAWARVASTLGVQTASFRAGQLTIDPVATDPPVVHLDGPVRFVSWDERLLFVGEGRVIDVERGVVVGPLGLSFIDAVFAGDHAILMAWRNFGDGARTVVTVLDRDLEQVWSVELDGYARRLLETDDGLHALVSFGGHVRVHRLEWTP